MSFTLLGILNSQAIGAGGGSSMDLLETINLSYTQNTIEFSNLLTSYGADYTHLQVRMSLIRPGNDNIAAATIRIQSGQDFGYYHWLSAQNTTVSAVSASGGYFYYAGRDSLSRSGPVVMDIYDAFSTTKNTTVKWIGGQAGNAEPFIQFGSAYRNNTAAVDSIQFYSGAEFAANSRFSIYGVKVSA